MRVIAQPMPANPTLAVDPTLPTDPTLTVLTTMVTSTQMSVTEPATTTAKYSLIPVTVYDLAQDKFKEVPYPTRKSQEAEGHSALSGSNPPEAQQPKAAATATTLQNRGHPMAKYHAGLYELVCCYGIMANPPYTDEVPTPTFVKTEKAEEKTPPKQAAISHALILNKPQNNKPA